MWGIQGRIHDACMKIKQCVIVPGNQPWVGRGGPIAKTKCFDDGMADVEWEKRLLDTFSRKRWAWLGMILSTFKPVITRILVMCFWLATRCLSRTNANQYSSRWVLPTTALVRSFIYVTPWAMTVSKGLWSWDVWTFQFCYSKTNILVIWGNCS